MAIQKQFPAANITVKTADSITSHILPYTKWVLKNMSGKMFSTESMKTDKSAPERKGLVWVL